MDEQPSPPNGRFGVVLLHRGEPATLEEVKPFCRALYADPATHTVPVWSEGQKWLAPWLARRPTREWTQALAQLGNRAPLRRQLEGLAQALEARINGDFNGTAAARCMAVVSSRTGAPTVEDAAAALRAQGLARWVAVSTYPHAHAGRSRPLVDAWLQTAADGAEVSVVDRYGEAPEYLAALGKCIRRGLEPFVTPDRALVLFLSAPPVQPSRDGETLLREQVARTVEAVTAELPNPHRLASSEPAALREVLASLKEEGHTQVLAVPLDCVADEAPVTAELDGPARAWAKQQGLKLERAPTPHAEPELVDALAKRVEADLERVRKLGLGQKTPAGAEGR